MRKAIITLLAVLMLISFVSCNDQKVTEEMREQALKDFGETLNAMGYIKAGGEEECEYDLSNWNSSTVDVAEKNKIGNILIQFVGTSDITSAKGTYEVKNVSIEYSGEDSDAKFSANYVGKGIEITYTENGKEKSLASEFDFTMGFDYNGGTKTAIVKEVVNNLSVNGTKYRPIELEGSVKNFQTKEAEQTITKAVCDGIELDCEKVQKLIDDMSV